MCLGGEDGDYEAYRQLCTAIRITSSKLYGADNSSNGSSAVTNKELEMLGSLVRTLGAVGLVAGKDRGCIGAGVGCGIVPALLSIFPQPRRELGKFTPESVILPPIYDRSSTSNRGPRPGGVLLGNAARCLMPYAGMYGIWNLAITRGHCLCTIAMPLPYALITLILLFLTFLHYAADAFSGTGGVDASGVIPDAAGQGCLQVRFRS